MVAVMKAHKYDAIFVAIMFAIANASFVGMVMSTQKHIESKRTEIVERMK